MAISPDEIKAQRDEKVYGWFSLQVKGEEEKIDRILKDKYPKPGQSVKIELSRSASEKIIDKLVEIYSKVGWKVTYPKQSKSGPCILAFEYSELDDSLASIVNKT